MRQVVEQYQIGFVFNPDNPVEIAQAIQAFFDAPDRQEAYRKNVQQAKRELCWQNEGQKLTELYQNIFQ